MKSKQRGKRRSKSPECPERDGVPSRYGDLLMRGLYALWVKMCLLVQPTMDWLLQDLREKLEKWFHAIWGVLVYGRVERKKLLDWLRSLTNIPWTASTLTAGFQDGILLCYLAEAVVPGCCPRPDLLNPKRRLDNARLGLQLLSKHVGVLPEVTPEEVVNASPAAERKLFIFLSMVREASVQMKLKPLQPPVHVEEDSSPGDILNCFAKGMGLILAVKGRKARFNIFFKDAWALDIVIEIQGPVYSVSSERITRRSPKKKKGPIGQLPVIEGSDHPNEEEVVRIPFMYEVMEGQLAVEYIPVETGPHRLSILCHGYHVQGSPYTITVEDSVGFDLASRQVGSPVQRKRSASLQATSDFLLSSERRGRVKEGRNVRLPEARTKQRAVKLDPVVTRRVLRYVLTVNGQEVAVDVQRSEFLGPALVHLKRTLSNQEQPKREGLVRRYSFDGGQSSEKSDLLKRRGSAVPDLHLSSSNGDISCTSNDIFEKSEKTSLVLRSMSSPAASTLSQSISNSTEDSESFKLDSAVSTDNFRTNDIEQTTLEDSQSTRHNALPHLEIETEKQETKEKNGAPLQEKKDGTNHVPTSSTQNCVSQAHVGGIPIVVCSNGPWCSKHKAQSKQSTKLFINDEESSDLEESKPQNRNTDHNKNHQTCSIKSTLPENANDGPCLHSVSTAQKLCVKSSEDNIFIATPPLVDPSSSLTNNFTPTVSPNEKFRGIKKFSEQKVSDFIKPGIEYSCNAPEPLASVVFTADVVNINSPSPPKDSQTHSEPFISIKPQIIKLQVEEKIKESVDDGQNANDFECLSNDFGNCTQKVSNYCNKTLTKEFQNSRDPKTFMENKSIPITTTKESAPHRLALNDVKGLKISLLDNESLSLLTNNDSQVNSLNETTNDKIIELNNESLITTTEQSVADCKVDPMRINEVEPIIVTNKDSEEIETQVNSLKETTNNKIIEVNNESLPSTTTQSVTDSKVEKLKRIRDFKFDKDLPFITSTFPASNVTHVKASSNIDLKPPLLEEPVPTLTINDFENTETHVKELNQTTDHKIILLGSDSLLTESELKPFKTLGDFQVTSYNNNLPVITTIVPSSSITRTDLKTPLLEEPVPTLTINTETRVKELNQTTDVLLDSNSLLATTSVAESELKKLGDFQVTSLENEPSPDTTNAFVPEPLVQFKERKNIDFETLSLPTAHINDSSEIKAEALGVMNSHRSSLLDKESLPTPTINNVAGTKIHSEETFDKFMGSRFALLCKESIPNTILGNTAEVKVNEKVPNETGCSKTSPDTGLEPYDAIKCSIEAASQIKSSKIRDFKMSSLNTNSIPATINDVPETENLVETIGSSKIVFSDNNSLLVTTIGNNVEAADNVEKFYDDSKTASQGNNSSYSSPIKGDIERETEVEVFNVAEDSSVDSLQIQPLHITTVDAFNSKEVCNKDEGQFNNISSSPVPTTTQLEADHDTSLNDDCHEINRPDVKISNFTSHEDVIKTSSLGVRDRVQEWESTSRSDGRCLLRDSPENCEELVKPRVDMESVKMKRNFWEQASQELSNRHTRPQISREPVRTGVQAMKKFWEQLPENQDNSQPLDKTRRDYPLALLEADGLKDSFFFPEYLTSGDDAGPGRLQSRSSVMDPSRSKEGHRVAVQSDKAVQTEEAEQQCEIAPKVARFRHLFDLMTPNSDMTEDSGISDSFTFRALSIPRNANLSFRKRRHTYPSTDRRVSCGEFSPSRECECLSSCGQSSVGDLETEPGFIDDEYSSLVLGNYVSFASLLDTDLSSAHRKHPQKYKDEPVTATYPDRCVVHGSGMYYGQVGVHNRFQVDTSAAGTGYLSLGIQGPETHSVQDAVVSFLGCSTYEIRYQAMEPGYYLITLKWSEFNVPDSPFICKVTY